MPIVLPLRRWLSIIHNQVRRRRYTVKVSAQMTAHVRRCSVLILMHIAPRFQTLRFSFLPHQADSGSSASSTLAAPWRNIANKTVMLSVDTGCKAKEKNHVPVLHFSLRTFALWFGLADHAPSIARVCRLTY